MHGIQPHATSYECIKTGAALTHASRKDWSGHLHCSSYTIREFRTITLCSVLVGIWNFIMSKLVLSYVRVHLCTCASPYKSFLLSDFASLHDGSVASVHMVIISNCPVDPDTITQGSHRQHKLHAMTYPSVGTRDRTINAQVSNMRVS